MCMKNLRDRICGIIGLNPKERTDEEIVNKIQEMDFEIRGKMGFMSLPLIEQVKREGYLRFNERDLTWNLRMTDLEMSRLLGR